MSSDEPFRWTARATTTGDERATVFARKNKIEIGLPLSFDVDYEMTTALEHVLGALAADIAMGMKKLAQKRRLEVDNVEVVVIGELDNPLMHIGVVGEKGHPGLKKLRIHAYVGSLEDESKVREVWNEMLEKSPLVNTFRPALEFEMKMDVIL
jgi:hypothetical protein